LEKNVTIMEYYELNVWIKCRELTNAIYATTKKFPPDELYGIINKQLLTTNNYQPSTINYFSYICSN